MKVSPLSIPNIRFFILFRVLFNARFYYPVFTILFLDFGLTIEQFALLNSVWAASIVLAEVPSGALADIVGRKRLLVAASILMMIEMALIGFVPLGNIEVIFWVFFINRVLSGLAEALASGADEALAYDTLVELDQQEDWPLVLDLQMRAKSAGFVGAMTIGALVYDPETVNRLLSLMVTDLLVSQQVCMRFPIYLTLLLAVMLVISTSRMEEPFYQKKADELSGNLMARTGETVRLMMGSAQWIARTGFALSIICFAMAYDHVLRLMVTMTSQYYRLIDLPEASFGVIGSAMAMLGLFVPKLARWMVDRFSPVQNMYWLTGFTFFALLGISRFFPYFGVIPVALLTVAMMCNSFFASHYLNRITASEQRATVLSFKGLALNLAYGSIGILYAILISLMRGNLNKTLPNLSEQQIKNISFIESISWFPWYAMMVIVLITLFSYYRMKGGSEAICKQKRS